MLTNHNNLQHFIDTKSLNSRQVYWAQELSKYYFWIDYYQSKANRAADILSQYLQRNTEEEATLWAKNTKILYQLEFLLPQVLELRTEVLSSLYQFFICGTVILPYLHQFWDIIQSTLAHKSLYITSIGVITMKLPKL